MREFGHELGLALSGESVDEFVDNRTDLRLEVLHPSRTEKRLEGLAVLGVLGRIDLDRDELALSCVDEIVRVTGERLGVTKDSEDLVVASDDPVATVVRGPDDRTARPELGRLLLEDVDRKGQCRIVDVEIDDQIGGDVADCHGEYPSKADRRAEIHLTVARRAGREPGGRSDQEVGVNLIGRRIQPRT